MRGDSPAVWSAGDSLRLGCQEMFAREEAASWEALMCLVGDKAGTALLQWRVTVACQTRPCASMASATLMKPAMLAPSE